mmetsp:Transcript_32438/g.72859  ORF Transcript_32438/g.72859 Transcript_32438/m.72859 type:complete len:80 (-) Transcript_32438:312-551(-)
MFDGTEELADFMSIASDQQLSQHFPATPPIPSPHSLPRIYAKMICWVEIRSLATLAPTAKLYINHFNKYIIRSIVLIST